jgi:hypothetical protein
MHFEGRGKRKLLGIKKRAFSSRHENRDEKAARKNTINPKFIFSSFALFARPVRYFFIAFVWCQMMSNSETNSL